MRATNLLPVLILWSASGSSATAQQPEAADLAQRRATYATVASNLAAMLRDGSAATPPTVEAATLEAQERWRVIALNAVQCSDARIVAVAKEGAEAHEAVLALTRQISD